MRYPTGKEIGVAAAGIAAGAALSKAAVDLYRCWVKKDPLACGYSGPGGLHVSAESAPVREDMPDKIRELGGF